LVGQRHVTVTEQRTAVDFAREVRNLLEVRYPHAEKVVLVMDNLNTHKPAALYQAFEPTVARSSSSGWRFTTPPSMAVG